MFAKAELKKIALGGLGILTWVAPALADSPNCPVVAWSVPLHGKSDSSPALGSDGTIYFGDYEGKLLALNADGSKKWEFTTGHGWDMGVEIRSSPALAPDGTIYFGSRDNNFYALRQDGRKKWQFKTGAWVDASPAITSDGDVCFGSWDGNFYELKPDGSERWRFATGGSILTSPVIGLDGAIYFGSHDHNFYALGPDGSKKWQFAADGEVLSSPAIQAAPMGNGPAAGTNPPSVYFTCTRGWLYALTLDGTLRWRLHTGGCTESSPVIGPDGTLYLGVNNTLWSVSPTGTKLRAEGTDTPIENAPVVLTNNSVCFASRYNLCNFSKEPGKGWYVYMETYGCASPAFSPEGVVYGVQGQKFVALTNAATVASSIWPRFRGNARNTGNARDLQQPAGK